jgi:hypothetical protein
MDVFEGLAYEVRSHKKNLLTRKLIEGLGCRNGNTTIALNPFNLIVLPCQGPVPPMGTRLGTRAHIRKQSQGMGDTDDSVHTGPSFTLALMIVVLSPKP